MPDQVEPAREEDFDARFAAIVEQFRAEAEQESTLRGETPRDPDSDGSDADAPVAGSSLTDGDAATTPPPRTAINPPPLLRQVPPPRPPPPPPALDVPVWRGATGDASYEEILERLEEEDHFIPPPPRPLPPQEDLHFWGIIIGLTGGTALMLWLAIVRPDVSDWWIALSILLIVGGFVLLVLRDSDDDDRGDGAVV